MKGSSFAGRRISVMLAGLIATIATVAALAIAASPSSDAAAGHHDMSAMTTQSTNKSAAFHDDMRKLWEDHITWTRLAIISFAADLPDLDATKARLLRNQVDIGNAIKPFYGKKAGNTLTKLLQEHIVGAVVLMQAAKDGDDDATARAKTAWYRNGNQVADFLSAANAHNWARGDMRSMMRKHLDDTLSEAVNRLHGNYAADIRDYDRIHHHILKMADALSDGIVAQFPRKFR